MINIINENSRIERRIIGTIDFGENLLNEVNVEDKNKFPRFKKSFSGKCTIEVYGSEGEYMPHFHIISNDKSFECCICIFDNRFFNHGKHQGILARKDWKILDEWMSKDNSRFKDKYNVKSNWDAIVSMWKQLNGENINIKTIEQPDYTTIKPYKGEIK